MIGNIMKWNERDGKYALIETHFENVKALGQTIRSCLKCATPICIHPMPLLLLWVIHYLSFVLKNYIILKINIWRVTRLNFHFNFTFRYFMYRTEI